jgi:hypothetical protein
LSDKTGHSTFCLLYPFIHVIRCTQRDHYTFCPTKHPTSSLLYPFRNVIRCTYYTTHLDTQTHSQPIRLGTSSVVLTTHSDTQTRRHNQSVYPRHPLYSMYSLFFNDSLTTNPFIHVIRCTTAHSDTQTHSQPIRLSTSSVVLTTHSDTQTRRHADTTNPFRNVIRCTYYTTHLDTQTHSQPIRLSIVILSS